MKGGGKRKRDSLCLFFCYCYQTPPVDPVARHTSPAARRQTPAVRSVLKLIAAGSSLLLMLLYCSRIICLCLRVVVLSIVRRETLWQQDGDGSWG